jgi:hypothetical protein
MSELVKMSVMSFFFLSITCTCAVAYALDMWPWDLLLACVS